MAPPHVFVSYTIQDGENKRSTMQIKFPIGSDIGVLRSNFVPTTATLLNAIITGRILDAGIGLGVDLSGATIRATPDANSDVEEGALFSNITAIGTHPSFRVPTFDESKFFTNTGVGDPTDPDLGAFILRIINGQTVGLVNVSPSDDHGDDITDVATISEDFQATRR